jgi:hypothetical protein
VTPRDTLRDDRDRTAATQDIGEEAMSEAMNTAGRDELGLEVGTPPIASVGAIGFGPDDILFVADNTTATIFAVDVADPGDEAADEPFDLDGVDRRLASFLGCSVDDISVKDMAVHPRTHNVYLSVMRGRGDDALPVIIRIDRLTAALEEVGLRDVAFSSTPVANAPSIDDERQFVSLTTGTDGQEIEFAGNKIRILREPMRQATVTDLAYVDGTLLVAGMSNEEFASNLRRIAFPFTGDQADNSLEIFHVSHGAWETAAPIRTFVPYQGGRSILASYTCTPVVHFPLDELTSGTKTVGRTVAELGAMNQPIDMVSFVQGGEEHLLVSNSRHPLLKIACRDIDAQEPLTQPQEPHGVPRQEEELQGVTRLANLGASYVLALQADDSGVRHLRSLKTASL